MLNISNIGHKHCAWGKICVFTDLSETWRKSSPTQIQWSGTLCRISSSQPVLSFVCTRHTWSYISIYHSSVFFFFAASFEGLKGSPQILLGNETENQNGDQCFKTVLRWLFISRKKALCWYTVMKRIPTGNILTDYNNPSCWQGSLTTSWHFISTLNTEMARGERWVRAFGGWGEEENGLVSSWHFSGILQDSGLAPAFF